jgi:DNA-binding response OmpR family regulator
MRQTVAVVDDEETIRETVAFALRREGYDVVTFRDGSEAWELLRDRLPALAILDITATRFGCQ